jgi:hypothetical protein
MKREPSAWACNWATLHWGTYEYIQRPGLPVWGFVVRLATLLCKIILLRNPKKWKAYGLQHGKIWAWIEKPSESSKEGYSPKRAVLPKMMLIMMIITFVIALHSHDWQHSPIKFGFRLTLVPFFIGLLHNFKFHSSCEQVNRHESISGWEDCKTATHPSPKISNRFPQSCN